MRRIDGHHEPPLYEFVDRGIDPKKIPKGVIIRVSKPKHVLLHEVRLEMFNDQRDGDAAAVQRNSLSENEIIEMKGLEESGYKETAYAFVLKRRQKFFGSK